MASKCRRIKQNILFANKVLLPLFALTFGYCLESSSQQYGLGFYGNEKVSDQRTSLVLGKNKKICTSANFSLNFKIRLNQNQTNFFGYVFRMVDENGKNIDLIFSENTYKLIVGQESINLNLKLDASDLPDKWDNFSLNVNTSTNQVSLARNGVVLSQTKSANHLSNCFTVYFGQCNHPNLSYKDVASMVIKDITVKSDDKIQHFWHLDESSENIAIDSKGRLNGDVINPKWLKEKIKDWQEVLNIAVHGVIANSYDSNKNELHFFSNTEHSIFDFISGSLVNIPYNNGLQNIAFGDKAIPLANENLILRLNSRQMFKFKVKENIFENNIPKADSLTEYWHHNTYVYPKDSALVTIGGYGMFEYKNAFHKFSFSNNSWSKISMTGDLPTPRYLAGFGSTQDRKESYYFGGYGSETGDQLITPKNYYDLYKIDWMDNKILKVYELPTPTMPFVFGSDLLINENDNSFLAIIFNQLKYNSALQLVKGSLEEPELKNIALAIPFEFNDVSSTVNLYQNTVDQKLYLTITHYNIEEDLTKVKVYTISTPHESGIAASINWTYAVSLFVILALILIAYFSRKKTPQAKEENKLPETKAAPPFNTSGNNTATEKRKSSIVLFGEFHLIDHNGKDLTRMVSPLIKEIMIYILMHSLRWNKGLNSAKLDDMFWYDKSKASARNNRAVNIRKLKSILEEVEGVALVKNTGNWEIEYDPTKAYIDYADFLDITLFHPENSKEQINELSSIVQRGTLLPNQDFDWLDSFSSETSNKIIDKYLLYLEGQELTKENAQEFIEIANNIFLFDSLEEMAMCIKCKAQHLLGKHSLAKETYEKFILNYQSLFGEKFDKTYQEVLES